MTYTSDECQVSSELGSEWEGLQNELRQFIKGQSEESQEYDNGEEDTGDDEQELGLEVDEAWRQCVIVYCHAMNRLGGNEQ